MAAGSDKQIAEAVAHAAGMRASSLGLRFDRVAVRVLGDLRRFAGAAAPAGTSVLLTLTAPIRLPAKTVAALRREVAALVADGAAGPDRSVTLHGNGARLRLVERPPRRGHKFIGFVHNPDRDATELLNLAEAWLRAEAEPEKESR